MPGGDDQAKAVIQRAERLYAERANVDRVWQDMADRMYGERDFTTSARRAQNRQVRIYDQTALHSKNLLAAAIHSVLTNRALQWFELEFEDMRLMQDRDVLLWLEDAASVMRGRYQNPEAGFDPQIQEVYNDDVGFSTAALFIDHVHGMGPMFSARPVNECYLGENHYGRVDTVVRKFQLDARQAQDGFGDAVNPTAAKRIGGAQEGDRHDYIHIVVRSTDPLAQRFPVTDKPWSSYYVSVEDRATMTQGGYHEMPYMTPRWRKESTDAYGRGCGWVALAASNMLQEMKKTNIEGAQLANFPPMLADDDGLLTQLRTAPRSINVQRASSLRENSVRPLHIAGDVRLGVEFLKLCQEEVRTAFHAELLPLFQGPYMTATQVLEMAQQAQRFIGPTMSRTEVELLDPMNARVFGICERAHLFLQRPTAIRGVMPRIKYVSPIARAQRSVEAKAIVDTLTVASNLSATFPGALDVFEMDDAIREIAKANGMPERLMKSQLQLLRLRREQDRERAAAEDESRMLEASKAASQLVPALAQAQATQAGAVLQ